MLKIRTERQEISRHAIRARLDGKRTRLAEVYADSGRPILNGDIVGDFAWRRTHEVPCSPAAVLDVVWPRLEEVFPTLKRSDVQVRYSRHCGCTMCPCSPGFVVTGPGAASDGTKLMIWLRPA